MKKIAGIIGLLVAIHILFGIKLIAQSSKIQKSDNTKLKLMTYNLKFASPTYKPSWEIRRDMQIDMIRKYDPDIIGTQVRAEGTN